MVKAIFFDVDGTLLSHTQHLVPLSTRKALELLRKKGIKCVVATGRHMLELSKLPVADIAFDAYITLNGQLCLDHSGAVILGNPIEGQDKEKIVHLFHEKSIPIILVEKDNMYLNFMNDHVEMAQQAISTAAPEVNEYTGNEIYQAIAFVDKGKEQIISAQLQECRITRWSDYAVDIISCTGGKTAGIKAYLKENKISVNDTVAFGDGENDIDMLEFVHTGIAMGNAQDGVKKRADYVTTSVDEHGIEKALRRLKIIE